MKKIALFLIAATLALNSFAATADAQVVVQQQRGLLRNSTTVAVGANAGNVPVVVQSQRGLIGRGRDTVVVGGAGAGGTYSVRQQEFFAPRVPAHHYHAPRVQQEVFLQRAPAYYQRPVVQQDVFVQRAPTYYRQRLVEQQTVYAAPPVVQQQYAPSYVPRQLAPSYAPAGCGGGGTQTFAPQLAPAPCAGCGGGLTASASVAMLQRFGY